jgi:hypothetical protein
MKSGKYCQKIVMKFTCDVKWGVSAIIHTVDIRTCKIISETTKS